MTPNTTVRKRLIGRALQRYREMFGYTLEHVADRLECDTSKVCRIENGQRGIRSSELRELLEWYGASEPEQDMLLAIEESTRGARRGWWQDYANVMRGQKLEYAALEQHATEVLAYGPTVIPDLLQTGDYARAAALASLDVPEGEEYAAAEAIRTRQDKLLSDTSTARYTAIVGEAALRQQVGDGRLMREQLLHLANLSDTIWITIHVLPYSAGVSALGGCGSFSILRFNAVHSLGLVHLDGPAGGVCLDDPKDITAYTQAFAVAKALSTKASLELIQRLTRR